MKAESVFSISVLRKLFFPSGGSATSSPAMLGIRRHSSNYQRAQSSMQLDTYYGDNSLHKQQYTGSYLLADIVESLRDLYSIWVIGVSHKCFFIHKPATRLHPNIWKVIFSPVFRLLCFSLQGLRRKPHISLGHILPSQERIWEGPR